MKLIGLIALVIIASGCSSDPKDRRQDVFLANCFGGEVIIYRPHGTHGFFYDAEGRLFGGLHNCTTVKIGEAVGVGGSIG